MLGQLQTGSQAGSGIARSRARAPLNWVSQRQRCGRCKVRRRADARCPASQVMRQHLHRQPGAVGGEAARGEMVEPDAVLEVSDGVLDLGVAAVVGLLSVSCQNAPGVASGDTPVVRFTAALDSEGGNARKGGDVIAVM